MSDHEIREGMRRSGIPDFVIPTTLPKEGHQDIRDIVQGGGYRHNGQLYGFYVYPRRDTSVTKARRVFYLIAKELYLSGIRVYCISMQDVISELTSEDYSIVAYALENVEMAFITDFYEDGAPCPLSPQDSATFRAWVRGMFESGKSVSFLSDAPTEQCSAWWPASFTGFIREHTLQQTL